MTWEIKFSYSKYTWQFIGAMKTETRKNILLYEVMAVGYLIPLCGCDRTLTETDYRRYKAAEMLRAVGGYKLIDRKKNVDIRSKLNIQNVRNKIKRI